MSVAEQKHDATNGGGSSCVYTTNDKIELGDLVQVIDNASSRVVIQGQICNRKDSNRKKPLDGDLNLFTVDNKHYFKLDSESYTVKKLDANFVDDDFIQENYNEIPWRHYSEADRDEVDMFREHNIEELDPEVINIVASLNRFSPYMLTAGSCSGHGKEQAWVSIRFEYLSSLNDFLDILVPFKTRIDLTTAENINTSPTLLIGKPFFPRQVEMCLKAKDIGEPGWKAFDEFAEYLERIIDIRNRSNNLLHKTIKLEKDRAAMSQNS